jgi:hypothetical protein
VLCSKWWCAGPSTLILRLEAGQLSMTSVPGANLVGKTGGLLGTYDDNTANDLSLANGTVLPADSSPQTIYYTFGESCECLFVCVGILLHQLSAREHTLRLQVHGLIVGAVVIGTILI